MPCAPEERMVGSSDVNRPGLALSGVAIGNAARYGLKQTAASYLLCGSVVLLVLNFVRILLWQLNRSAPLLPMVKTSLLEIAVSMVFAPLIWLLLHKVYDRVGGTKLM